MLSYPVGTGVGYLLGLFLFVLNWSYCGCCRTEEGLSRVAPGRGSGDNGGCVWGLGGQEETAGGSGGDHLKAMGIPQRCWHMT